MHSRIPSWRRLAGLLVALLLGCGSGGSGTPDADAPDADGGGQRWPSPEHWCQRIAGGPPGARALALDLSAAHAAIRFFGAEPGEEAPAEEGEEPGIRSCGAVDAALAGALGDPVLRSGAVNAYADALQTVCAVGASERSLGPVEVTMHGDTAVVRPGTGELTIPEGTRALALDLRDLPDAPELDEALRAITEAWPGLPLHPSTRRVREHTGPTDEVVSDANVYSNRLVDGPDRWVDGESPGALALIVGPVLPPRLAELAGALRLDRQAWLVGHGVPSRVAESRWQGVGDRGLAYRAVDLYYEGQRWPDLIPADRPMDALDDLLDELPGLGLPPAVDAAPAERPALRILDCYRDNPSRGAGLGEARAALIAAHGTARLFFPYFATVGDTIDARLLETLEAAHPAAAEGRRAVGRLLRRLGEALHDGHVVVLNYGGGAPIVGVLPVLVEHLPGGQVVVRRTIAEELAPGDEILEVNGVPIDAWLDAELPLISAATEAHRRVRSDVYLQNIEHTAGLLLQAPDGETRTEFVDPYPFDALAELGSAPSLREAGPLDDLGAPELYYVNLADTVLTSMDDFHAALRDAASHDGLVLDMRGYPGIDHYEVAMRLIPGPFQSPIFRTPVLTPDGAEVQQSQYTLQPLSDLSFHGPVALLVGPGSVSAAENLALMLTDAGRVTVVGRRSAGTDGNITGVQLPGRFGFTFTGMEVRHADGAVFHGQGIVPDVEVVPTVEDLAAERDPALLEAIDVLQEM